MIGVGLAEALLIWRRNQSGSPEPEFGWIAPQPSPWRTSGYGTSRALGIERGLLHAVAMLNLVPVPVDERQPGEGVWWSAIHH